MNTLYNYEETNMEDARSAYIRWFLDNHPEIEFEKEND
jgi:hypothetical protein